jgi:chromosome segregation ATPase
MSHNPLPIPDLPEASGAPTGNGRDALGLHARLQTAFSPQGDVVPKIGAADAARAFAAATLRHGEAFQDFQDRVVQLESGPDVGAVRETVRDLCEALLHLTVETKKSAAAAEERFESLSDAMAILSGHLASQRQEVQANIAATTRLGEHLQQLQDELAGQRAEAAQIKELTLSTGQSLRNDVEELKDQAAPLNSRLQAEDLRVSAIENRIAALPELQSGVASLTGQVDELKSDAAALGERVNDLEPLKASVAQLFAEDARLVERSGLLADELDSAKGQVAGLEDTVAALADSSIRSSEGLSVLGNALEAAKTQIFSLSETSVYLTERLRIAEQVVEEASRREKILATLHARAARTLQSGQ